MIFYENINFRVYNNFSRFQLYFPTFTKNCKKQSKDDNLFYFRTVTILVFVLVQTDLHLEYFCILRFKLCDYVNLLNYNIMYNLLCTHLDSP